MRLLVAVVVSLWTVSTPAFEPEMVRIPGGTYIRGHESCDADFRIWQELVWQEYGCPRQRIRIAAFEVGKYEITSDQWEACVRDKGCKPVRHPRAANIDWGGGNWPIIHVSWNDAQAYVAWLRRKTGKAYRLLSEAEWEYAARAGSDARYSWGDQDPVCDENAPNGANFQICPDFGPRPVGSFQPNAFGLYDMHGNVSEWVEDCWHESYEGAPTDGSAWTTDCLGNFRVFRGGGWAGASVTLSSASRLRYDADYRNFGFRIARTL